MKKPKRIVILKSAFCYLPPIDIIHEEMDQRILNSFKNEHILLDMRLYRRVINVSSKGTQGFSIILVFY